ncbi:MAG TPA: C39 family peptidase [Geminicoccaceae bacterium]|nr:C39 family peptidase [Geminicoccaceae bacterium]
MLALGLALVPGAAAPAAAADGRVVKSLREFRHERVVIQQFDLSCGAAALATLLNYQHGDPVTEREIARELIRREEYLANPDLVRIRHGFSFLDLKRYADGRGYRGVGLGRLTMADLEARAPVIVPVELRGFPHFVVFRGRVGDRVLLADPAFGTLTVRADRFEAAWLDYGEHGRVGLVVERRDGLPPPDRLRPSLDEFVLLR